MTTKTTAAILAALLAPASAHAVSPLTPYSLTSTTYGQSFDSLANTGTSQALPAGWQIAELGSSTSGSDDNYAAGNGSSNQGNVYSFGAAGSSDRALGSLTSGTATPLYFGAILQNALGTTINALSIAYTGEQWRLANGTGDALLFEYSTDATSIVNGNWTRVTSLDFNPVFSNGTATGAALDGNLSANRSSVSGTIANLAIASGARFGLRWTDLDMTGSDQGLAVDDFSLTARTAAAAVPEPAMWAMMLGGFGFVGLALRGPRRRMTARNVAA